MVAFSRMSIWGMDCWEVMVMVEEVSPPLLSLRLLPSQRRKSSPWNKNATDNRKQQEKKTREEEQKEEEIRKDDFVEDKEKSGKREEGVCSYSALGELYNIIFLMHLFIGMLLSFPFLSLSFAAFFYIVLVWLKPAETPHFSPLFLSSLPLFFLSSLYAHSISNYLFFLSFFLSCTLWLVYDDSCAMTRWWRTRTRLCTTTEEAGLTIVVLRPLLFCN